MKTLFLILVRVGSCGDGTKSSVTNAPEVQQKISEIELLTTIAKTESARFTDNETSRIPFRKLNFTLLDARYIDTGKIALLVTERIVKHKINLPTQQDYSGFRYKLHQGNRRWF